MSLQALQEMAAKDGVGASDAQRLHGAGLTQSTAEKGAQYGITVKDIWNLFQQFGPSALTILTTLLAMFKSPQPAPQPVPEPAPAPEPPK